jgi:hypothetical protein
VERGGTVADLGGRCLATSEVAGPDEHGGAVGDQLCGELLAHALVGSGDQGDAVGSHDGSPVSLLVKARTNGLRRC